MYAVIISAHNKYASGVYSGLKLICGDMENVAVVDYLENQSPEDLDQNLKSAYQRLEKYDRKIFITDLLGGTPFLRSVLNFGKQSNVRILTGLNFPLLYTAAITDTGDFDADIKTVLDAGREGITVYTKIEEKEDTISDDGI